MLRTASSIPTSWKHLPRLPPSLFIWLFALNYAVYQGLILVTLMRKGSTVFALIIVHIFSAPLLDTSSFSCCFEIALICCTVTHIFGSVSGPLFCFLDLSLLSSAISAHLSFLWLCSIPFIIGSTNLLLFYSVKKQTNTYLQSCIFLNNRVRGWFQLFAARLTASQKILISGKFTGPFQHGLSGWSSVVGAIDLPSSLCPCFRFFLDQLSQAKKKVLKNMCCQQWLQNLVVL